MRSFGIILAVILLDQGTKAIAQTSGDVVVNPGISFGVFPGGVSTAVMVLVAGTVFLLVKRLSLSKTGESVFVGAAVSNLIDRILVGGVRDFLPVPFTPLKNNLADWILVFSLVLFVRSLLRRGNAVQYPV